MPLAICKKDHKQITYEEENKPYVNTDVGYTQCPVCIMRHEMQVKLAEVGRRRDEAEDVLDIQDTERGNNLVVRGDAMAAWITLAGKKKLEVTWTPGNYPALTVSTTDIADADLASHMKDMEESGWDIVKNNT
jgi:hypothetical protein